MPLEPGNQRPSGLVITNPFGSDSPSEGDDHIRLIKEALKLWSGVAGEDASLVNYLDTNYADEAELAALNGLVSQNTTDIATNTSAIVTLDAEKAPLADPALTGNATLDGQAVISADPANYLQNLTTVIYNHTGGNLDVSVHKGKLIRMTGNVAIVNMAQNDRLDFFNSSTGDLLITGLVGAIGNGTRDGTQITVPGEFGGTLIKENDTFHMWVGAGSVS